MMRSSIWFHQPCALCAQDPIPIYWANIAVLAACYGYGFTIGKPDDGSVGMEKNQPKWLKFIYKVLYV